MERYNITAVKDNDIIYFSIMADCHEQHIWSEDILVGVSKRGAKKLDALAEAGYSMIDDTPYRPKVVGWR